MDPARLRQVDELFHRALELEASARAAFLDGECSDPEVRRAVEAMLAGELPAGTLLGPYRVEGPIGSGGMGTVYRAIDGRLHRPVAIKVASAGFSARFKREAHAIAALNHPYVCTLYDIGPNYLVMEFVEGATLHQLMRERRLPVEETLQYAAQIAAAMEAAHAAGIVHRDLKPRNVMVTKAGMVKVLDFGLAQMTGLAPGAGDATVTIGGDTGETRPGTIVGSPPYMSPEQALGKPLDARSDVFSFGAVLYEMLAAKKAFGGESALETLSGIIHKEVPPPSASNPEVVPELDALVRRCLRKNAAERFPDMSEVRRELKSLAAEASIAVTVERAVLRLAGRRWRMWGPAAAAAVVLAAGFLWWRGRPEPARENAGGAPEMKRVTTDRGLSINPAITQDGKLVAYASDRSGDGNLDLWVQQVGGGDPIRITRDAADDSEPNFSPDGTRIVFRSERNGGGVYIVPTTGGQERRIADAGRRPMFSPDGTKVVYWTGPAAAFPLRTGVGKIFVLDLAANATRPIRPEFAAATHPVWSPDGTKILFAGIKEQGKSNWWISPLNAGTPVACEGTPGGGVLDPIAWQNDWVYFLWGSTMRPVARLRLNAATGQAGSPVRLSAVTADAHSAALSQAGQAVLSVVDTTTSLYDLALDADAGTAKGEPKGLSKNQDYQEVESISANGTRVAYITIVSGNTQVAAMDLTTGRSHAVTEGGRPKGQALISPDGERIAWMDPDNSAFVTAFEGGATRKLCERCGSVRAWSPDGSYLLYTARAARSSVGLLEVASGKTSVYLTSDSAALRPRALTGDGKWIAFTADGGALPDFKVYAAPFSVDRPPPPSEWVEVAGSAEVHPDPQWSPDGSLMYFSSEKDGYTCIWAIRLNRRTKRPEGRLFPVQHFHSPSLQLLAPSLTYPMIALSRERMVVSLRERSGGIWMLPLPGGK